MENKDKPATEITKREHIAIIILQGLLVGRDGLRRHTIDVSDAIITADELLKQLEQK